MQVLNFGREEAAGPCLIFLHGFPALRSKQNREFAEIVSHETGLYSVLPLYRGLGFSPGQFSFTSCLTELFNWYRNFLDARRTRGLHLNTIFIGHSFGGFISLLLATRDLAPVNKMILLSPLLEFTVPENLNERSFREAQDKNPNLNLLEPTSLARDFQDVGRRWSVPELLSGLCLLQPDVPILFLQARDDKVTPTSTALAMKDQFPAQLKFELVDQDHSFLINRPAIAARIIRFILSGE